MSIIIALTTGAVLVLMAWLVASWQSSARQAAVLVEARALADAVGRVDTESESAVAALQTSIQGLKEKLPGLKEALVLEGTQFVAHSSPDLAGTRLKRDDLSHKSLYDDSKALQENLARNLEEKQKYADLAKNPYLTAFVRPSPGGIYVAAPARAGDEMKAMVVLTVDPPATPAGPFAFQLVLAGVGLILLGIVFARLAPGALAVVGLLYLAAAGYVSYTQVEQSSSTLRQVVGGAAARGVSIWSEVIDATTAAVVPPAAEVPVAPGSGEGLAPGDVAAAPPGRVIDPTPMPGSTGGAPGGEAAAPAGEGSVPGKEGAAPGAEAPAAGAPAGEGAAPAPKPTLEHLLAAINLDEYGNPLGWFEAAGKEPLTGDNVVTEGGGSIRYASALAVEATWAWRGLGALLGLFGLYLVLLVTGKSRKIADVFVEHGYAYGYIAPAVIGTALLVFGPFLFGIVLGFYTRVYSTYEFVGFQNFIDILSDFHITQTKNFYRTLGVTVMWTVVNVSLHVSIGLALALILKDTTLRFTPVYRTLLVIPWALPNYITALIWRGMFNKEYGAVNSALALLGIEPVSWFNSFWGAFTANLVTNVWLGFPFMMVISLGALQSIPAELYEAAEVDGAGRWQRFRHITLPLLKPALFPAVILGTIWTFNQFNVIYLVSAGAPDGETDILITEAYRWAFEGRQQYGYAAAYSTIIFLILFGYTYVTNRITKSTEGAYE